MRSPPRKPTASGSSKSSFHFKTPDGRAFRPPAFFSFPAPQQRPGFPAKPKEGYSLCSRRGQFPLRGKGKESLAQSPPLRPPPETWGTPPYTVTAIRFPALMGIIVPFPRKHLALSAPAALCAFPLEIPPKERRGSNSGKRSRGRPICSTCVRRTFWCGDALI